MLHNKITLAIWILSFCVLAKPETKEKPPGQVIVEEFSIQDIYNSLKDSCFLVATQGRNSSTLELLKNLTNIFQNEQKVCIGILTEESSFTADKSKILPKNVLVSRDGCRDEELIFYPRRVGDRRCLLRPAVTSVRSKPYVGKKTTKDLLNFLNSNCGTHRDIDGGLNIVGYSIQSILENVFHVQENGKAGKAGAGPERNVDFGMPCEKISMPTKDEFLHNYLFRSKPVIIKGGMKNWPALKKWKNEFLNSKYGKREVCVAFAPNGEYEGCEKAASYEDFKTFKLPQEVKKQLPFPDLVVVRPAFMNIKFSEFMNILENKNNIGGKFINVTAYLEYTSIPSYFPELENDIEEMEFAKEILERKHLNIWLSDGNTLGKLHFDPFDNLLCQISGKKQVILYEPHDNTRLYEAHIQEAMLGYNSIKKTFHRKKLLDSTSMVMSPVNILNPDFKRFPKFQDLKAMNCTIGEGEVLYMPAFWWHEVQSYPSKEQPRNLAVNLWYEPFFTKEYPCDICKLEVNSFYHHLLR